MESALSTIGLINSCLLLPFVKIPAETLLSIHDSPFPTYDQDSVGTFPAPPGGSLGYDSYLFRGSGPSTVTQDEPEVGCLSLNEVMRFYSRNCF